MLDFVKTDGSSIRPKSIGVASIISSSFLLTSHQNAAKTILVLLRLLIEEDDGYDVTKKLYEIQHLCDLLAFHRKKEQL